VARGIAVIGILSAIVRVLLVLFVVRLVLRLFTEFRRGRAGRPARAGVPPSRDLVRDRVCNTFVPRDRALVVRSSAGDEYYCSPACRDKAREGLAEAR
jgi:hypothetical protein